MLTLVSSFVLTAAFALLAIIDFYRREFGGAIFASGVVTFLILVAICGGLP